MAFAAAGDGMGDDIGRNLVKLLALEIEIAEAIDRITAVQEEHTDSDSAFRRFGVLAGNHRKALETRLRSLPSNGRSAGERFRGRVEPGQAAGAADTVSGALETLHRLLNEAAFGYAALHAVAHRHYDSKGEGNTADLAEEHLREYAGAIQGINGLISDVVVWEMGKAGQECQCKCPSCGLGVCLCAPHGTNTVIDIRREGVPSGSGQPVAGIRVRPPRADSAAHRAGLQPRDVIVAVDEQDITNETWDAISAMQESIRKHSSGESVRFRVKRASGTFEEISVVRP